MDLESALRKGDLDHDLMECGRRAVAIRKVNAERVALKNAINQCLGEGVADVKKDHGSEGTAGGGVSPEEFRARYMLPGSCGARQ